MIRVLDPIVASQIAAGEVVERPASVVKELVENALDAGARRVTVEVRGGGITELTIRDDGSGIPSEQVELAFQRHATSKLVTSEDLYAIGTLGFRGEALPSIASVAQVICTTRTADEAAGVELRIAGGEIQSRSSVGSLPGTIFTIRNLFYNIPVRREFLRSASAETAAIMAIVTQYVLAYPHVRFSLIVDGKPRLQTSGSGHVPDVMLSIYGLEVARAMLPIEYNDGGNLTGIAMRGLVSPPTLSRGSRDAMHLSVNGRAIAPRGQVAAILDDAYHTFLMKGRFPYAVLGINVHPSAVDVNVHPQKSEVKFRDPERVRNQLARAIRTSIQGSMVMQGWDGGTHIPSESDIDSEWHARADVPEHYANTGTTSAPQIIRERSIDEGSGEQGSEGAVRPTNVGSAGAETVEDRPRSTQIGNEGGESVRDAHRTAQFDKPRVEERENRETGDQRNRRQFQSPADTSRSKTAENSTFNMPRAALIPAEQSAFLEQEASVAPRSAPLGSGLPRLRALAQLARMYLLAEGPEGDLYLIDQHAAHERITYERLMAQRGAGQIESQRLLMPQAVPLAPAAQATLLAASSELGTWGFELEEADFGVRVRAIPAAVALEELKAALLEVADHLSGAGGSTPEVWREKLLTTLSCHTSIRTGHPLTSSEQQALNDHLAQCQGPRTCPHGRPTVIVMTKNQLTRQFGRLG